MLILPTSNGQPGSIRMPHHENINNLAGPERVQFQVLHILRQRIDKDPADYLWRLKRPTIRRITTMRCKPDDRQRTRVLIMMEPPLSRDLLHGVSARCPKRYAQEPDAPRTT